MSQDADERASERFFAIQPAREEAQARVADWTERLQAICEQASCPPGLNRFDFIANRLAALQSAEARAREVEARVEVLEKALTDHNDLLRSAFGAAQRDAAHDVRGTTNYRTLADRAHEVLTKHHATVNAARKAVENADG